ncbi:UbiA family prenyltransferase [Saccharopolyspora sp. ASAGF58]|uniref:UbiA family prenyltransferase n=1 Tax=Saccharopolyspora sp. ASAGF58 TaxID=2719023 RepID=UPI001447A7D8|nr:UbiA family prenyltransferase [Saccharopolyspora sp. ASAGF58]
MVAQHTDTGVSRPESSAGTLQRCTASAVELPRRLAKELRLSWKFIENDPVGFYPGILFTIAVSYNYRLSPGDFALTAAGSLVYFWLYLYTFCLTNQLAGRNEDRLNKPFRPLVSGAAAARGTVVRAIVANIAFLVVGVLLGVWPWALIWQALTLLHNVAGGARNWVVKDFVIASGVPLMLGPAWQMVAPLTADTWRWIWALAIPIFFLIPVQDLRDIRGDKASRRATFPTVFGETFARRFLLAGFVLLPLIDHFFLIRASGGDLPAWLAEAATAALCWTIAWRVARRHGAAHDHRTYRFFEYWYILVVASAAVAL